MDRLDRAVFAFEPFSAEGMRGSLFVILHFRYLITQILVFGHCGL